MLFATRRCVAAESSASSCSESKLRTWACRRSGRMRGGGHRGRGTCVKGTSRAGITSWRRADVDATDTAEDKEEKAEGEGEGEGGAAAAATTMETEEVRGAEE